MIGDGCCCSGNLSFTALPGEALDHFVSLLREKYTVRDKANTEAKAVNLRLTGEVAAWLKEDDLWGHRSYDKFIPPWVFDLDRDGTTLFVEALWATDGCIKGRSNGYSITYTSVCRRLAYEVKALLLKFNILASVQQREAGCNGKRCRDAYLVRVTGRGSQELFLRTFRVKGKHLSIRDDLAGSNNNRDTLPDEFAELVYQLCDQAVYRRDGSSLRKAGLRRRTKYPVSAGKLTQYIEWAEAQGLDAGELRRLQAAEVTWDTVVAVDRVESAPCWDISVDTYHNYAIDGLVVHNSTGLAASSILRARSQSFYNSVTVMPLFEQVRKFSNNYVKPFLLNSPIKNVLVGDFDSSSVLQRDLANGSSLFYSYSCGDPSRVRGVAADELNFDEAQDLDHQDLAIIEAALSASKFKLSRYSGTPKTFDNTIHILWEDSSQAHWHIPCACGHINRCCTDADLLKMLGPVTLICGKCARPVNSRVGFWVHDYPDKQLTFAGYHVPQPILPMHYELPRNWQLLLELQREKQPYFFYNEILGESFDTGAKIITADEVKKACVVKPAEPRKTPNSRFISSALGIDWGGRGKERSTDTDEFISNTAFAIAGLNPDLTVDVTYLHKVPYSTDASLEAEMAVNLAADAKVHHVAMDYGGQGNVQENAMRAHGLPMERVCPFTYSVMSPTKPIVFYVAPTHEGVRSSYTLDKPRSILLLCELIKRGHVRLPNSDTYVQNHLRDFLNIYEESIDNPRGSPTRLVKRMSRRTDDVVHAINFAVMALFHTSQSWPRLADAFVQGRIIRP
jgi:hypothetical protein